MKYYLYIILTVNNTLYCGITPDVAKRYKAHLMGKGAKYTKSNKPLKIVYLEEFPDKSMALKEEYRIKKTLTREKKLELIEASKKRTDELLSIICP